VGGDDDLKSTFEFHAHEITKISFPHFVPCIPIHVPPTNGNNILGNNINVSGVKVFQE
jgi:hypothetical protein